LGLKRTLCFEADAILAMSRGRITHFGRAEVVRPQLGAEVEVENFGADRLILPGFIDAHAHYPQTSILGAYGEQLIDWLNKYSFVAEQHFADKSYAREAAQVFLRECLRAGTTTAAVFCSVHPESVEAFFEVAEPLGVRMIAGKLLMDRNAPEELCDSAQSGYEQSMALILAGQRRGGRALRSPGGHAGRRAGAHAAPDRRARSRRALAPRHGRARGDRR
jgi:guanine deaminase